MATADTVRKRISFISLGVLVALSLVTPANAGPLDVLTFTKSFDPANVDGLPTVPVDPFVMGPGSTTTLSFTITNTDLVNPASDMAFTDTLPAGVMIATPSSAFTDCTDGILSAPDGGTVITFSDGKLGAGSSCIITVNVTSSDVGMHPNTSGDLSFVLLGIPDISSGATATLTVDALLPGFSKSFAPMTIFPGGTSILTLTINNMANPAAVDSLSATDPLPPGMVVATPANALNGCGGTLTAASGTNSIFFSGSVAAFSSCTVFVDVTVGTSGVFVNTSLQLSVGGFIGFATAALDVPLEFLTKSFTDDPVPPGGTVTLEFTITNLDRSDSATSIAFDDSLPAGLTFDSLLNDDCGGSLNTATPGLLSYSGGGSLAPGASCTIEVSLDVPAGASAGTFPNTTTAVTADIGGVPFVGNMATDNLVVNLAPILTKEFTDDPVVAGGTVTLRFTITNPSTSSATAIAFSDDLPTVLLTAAMTPGADPCGVGSSATFTPLGDPGALNPPQPGNPIPAKIALSGAELTPAGTMGDSCTFDFVLDVAATVATGTFVNTTSEITATVGGPTLVGAPATDGFLVVAAPVLSKTFDGPVVPGGTVTLEFTLSHSENAPADALGISFSDPLGFAPPGLTVSTLPANGFCGAGSQISGTTVVSVTGASLTPGESCTFSVVLDVPAAADAENHLNTTSAVSATVGGLTVAENPAQDILEVASFTLSKTFTDDPVVPGGTVTLEFVLTNNGLSDATAVAFTDDIEAALTGLSPTGLPMAACGGTIDQMVMGVLDFSGGMVDAGMSCMFSVTLDVPAGAAADEYTNTTSDVTVTLGVAEPIDVPGAQDNLVVIDALSIAKSFTDDPVLPGGTVTLEFTLSNASPVETVAGIEFDDDLTAVLAGLASIGLPMAACGGTIDEVLGVLEFTGGTLAPNSSCIFSVMLAVPAAAPAGNFLNTTTALMGTLPGPPPMTNTAIPVRALVPVVTGNAATAVLIVAAPVPLPTFSKSFAPDPIFAGSTSTLTFTIDNTASPVAATNLVFTDNLPPGVTVATPADASTSCGAGTLTAPAGSSVITHSGGGAPALGTCTIQVDVTSGTGGAHLNTTGDLTSSAGNSGTASDTLTVNPQPTFTKIFAPNPIPVGGTSTLTFTIDNGTSTVALTGLDFTDNLPAGVTIASASTSCGGSLTATAGTTVVTLTGGTVGAGAVCTVTVDVTGTAAGMNLNTTGNLTSSAGNSGTATDTLIVNPAPVFSKAFSPDTIASGGNSTLTFTIDNTSNTAAASSLAFTDTLPAGVSVATPANTANSCGGTLTATSGTGLITLSGGTVAAGTTCMISVSVTSVTSGMHLNTTGDLTSSLGNSGAASDTLTVPGPSLDAVEIPTLNQWGLLILGSMLAFLAWRRLRQDQASGSRL